MTFECRCEAGEVRLLQVSVQVRYVCPENGSFVYCEDCQGTRGHRCEVLWPEKDRPPTCPTHRIPMVVQS